MATPTKPNDTETPLSVIPGVPHWAYENKHGQRNHGQGYDYHDPTGLQQANSTGGYGVGNAITMYGVVGFRPDQALISTEHGNVVDVYLTRRFGTQGTYDFYIYYDPTRSDGVPGNFRTDVEHGFDVCRCDFDLGTLNPEVSAAGLGRWRVRFEHGVSLMRLRAIVPFRTTVRTLDPVPLVDSYTYYVNEKYTAFAGHAQDAVTVDQDGVGKQFSSLTTDNFKALWDNYHVKDKPNKQYFLHNDVEQHQAQYQVLTLPLPTSFVKPLVGVPEAEDWKNQYKVWDRVLTYKVGRTFACLLLYRMYGVENPGWANGWAEWRPSRHGRFPSGGGDRYSTATYRVFDPDDPNAITRQPEGFQYQDFGYGDNAWWWMGSDSINADLVWSSNGELDPKSGYESIQYVDEKQSVGQTNPFQIDYSDYSNSAAGEIKTLPAIDHIKLNDTSYNVIFNSTGTDKSTLLNSNTVLAVSGSIQPSSQKRDSWAGKRVHPGRAFDFHGDNYPLYTLTGPYVDAPYGDSNGKFDIRNGDPYALGIYVYGTGRSSYHTNIQKQSDEHRSILFKTDASWAYGNGMKYNGFLLNIAGMSLGAQNDLWSHNPDVLYDTGMGHDNTTHVYELSTFVTPPEEYKQNDMLKGYYKCCVDHNDRKIQLFIEKVNENDPVGYDDTIESQILISKKPIYNVKQHATYDNTVQEDHAMDPVGVFRAYQSWGDLLPQDRPVVEQLFTSEGADPASQVQFLSLSAGALEGGSAPSNGISKPQPTSGPTLLVTPSNLVRDIVSRGVEKTWTRRFKNTGSGEIDVHLNNLGNGIVSVNNEPYSEGLDTTTNTITAAGDKTEDWSWNILGANGTSMYRQVGNDTSTFKLSADEYVDIEYKSLNTTLNAGYNVAHEYEAHFPQPIGTKFDKIVFEVSF